MEEYFEELECGGCGWCSECESLKNHLDYCKNNEWNDGDEG